jgi:hypothetical protein
MATRSVILDGWGCTLEVTVPGIEALIAEGTVRANLSHYGGDLDTANVYSISDDYEVEHGRAAIHRIAVLLGASALSRVMAAADESGHRASARDAFCERCGIHLSEWDLKGCTGRRAVVRVQPKAEAEGL